MGFMVRWKEYLPLESNTFRDRLFDPQFFLQPGGYRLTKLTEPSRGVGKVGLEDPFEAQERFFVENRQIEGFPIALSLLKTIIYCIDGKS